MCGSLAGDDVKNDSVCSTYKEKFKRLFHWGPAIAMWLIFTIILATLRCVIQIAPPSASLYGFAQFSFICFWFYVILNSYLCAVFVGPGFAPLKWLPPDPNDRINLQYCSVCEGFKPPRAHHCRTCRRCVLKMDHHCPWINTCCGHLNHGYFLIFLLSVPLGCISCATVLSFTLYRNSILIPYIMVQQHTLGLFLALAELLTTVFALGLAVGVTLAVGTLAYFQLVAISRNQTGIESWIVSKAQIWHKEADHKKPFRYPYDLGRIRNIRQGYIHFVLCVFVSTHILVPLRNFLKSNEHIVLTLSGRTVGDGYIWPVQEGCGQFDLTLEQIFQKQMKNKVRRDYEVIREYSGSICTCCKYGFCTELRAPCVDEQRIRVCVGDIIQVTRGTKYWIYGQLCVPPNCSANGFSSDDGSRERNTRGWIPRLCATRIVSKNQEKDMFQKKDD